MKINRYLKKIFIFFKNEVLYGGHLQCLSLVSAAWIASFLMMIPTEWSMYVIIYLSTYIAYAYNRYQEIEKDSLDNIERTRHLKIYRKKIPLLAMGAFVLMLFILLPRGGVIASTYIFFILIFGFAYTQWLKPATKKIPLLKNISVAVAFALGAGFIFPYNLMNPIYFIKEISCIGSFIFLRVLFMQIFLDLKDCRSDSARGLKTMAVLVGKRFTLNFLKWAFWGSSLPLIIGVACGFLPIITLVLLLTLFLDHWAINLVKKDNRLGYLIQGAHAISWSVILMLGNFIF